MRTLSNSPTRRVNRLYQVVNNLSHQAGAHAIRLGADFLYNDDRITFPRANRGTYTFSSLANFLAGAYNNAGFTQTFGATDVSQTNPNIGVYVQDEWKVSPGVTLNAGVRYDLQFLDTIDTVHALGFGDTVYVAPNEVHQFRNTAESEPFGFLCLVDAERDRPMAVSRY